MAIEFTSDLEVKVPHIDEQHKGLIGLINNLMVWGNGATNKDEIDKAIAHLGAYVVEHFRDEEELQRKSGYPKYAFHKQEHEKFLAAFQELKTKYNEQGASFNFTMELNKSIIDWIMRHIRVMDKELGAFLNSKG